MGPRPAARVSPFAWSKAPTGITKRSRRSQNGWPIPVFLQKPESDANFETLSRILLENEAIVTAAFGSHNVRSIAHAQAMADELGIDRSRFEFQLLYGMAGPIKRALVEMGYRVREYCPVGELLPGMSYLVRRLLENTSNEGFLRAKFSDNVSAARAPARSERTASKHNGDRCGRRAISQGSLTPPTARPATRRPVTPTRTLRWSNFVYRRAGRRCAPRSRKCGPVRPEISARDRRQKIWTGKRIASINPTNPETGCRRRGAKPEFRKRKPRCRLREKHSSLVSRARRRSRAIAGARCHDHGPPALSNFPPWKFSRSESHGPKPTAISARRSISPLLRAANAACAAARD